MDVEINFVGVLAATLVSMVVGGLWYSKAVFGKEWAKLAKINENKSKKDAPKALVGMLALSLVMAYILAHVTYLSSSFFAEYSYQGAAISSSLWMWIGFVVPIVSSDSLFNQAPWKLTFIQLGNWLVTLVGMGLVIGAIGL